MLGLVFAITRFVVTRKIKTYTFLKSRDHYHTNTVQKKIRAQENSFMIAAHITIYEN
jgi:hypothetical protein